jgi:hypothetical protein
MRAEPGRWALFGVYGNASIASTTGTRLRRAGFETRTAGAELYARWPAGGGIEAEEEGAGEAEPPPRLATPDPHHEHAHEPVWEPAP